MLYDFKSDSVESNILKDKYGSQSQFLHNTWPGVVCRSPAISIFIFKETLAEDA